MLPKKNRFSFKTQLPKQTLNSQSFSLRYGQNEEGLKVGVVVSKKVDTSAVVRNRIRRKIFDAVGKSLGKDSCLTLIFYARKQSEGQDIEQEVIDSVKKINNG
jgi:ribonuclease P protein component